MTTKISTSNLQTEAVQLLETIHSTANTAANVAALTYSSANAAANLASSVTASVTVYATPDLLPLSSVTAGAQAFVTSTNRLYIWTGTGWYNIALINTNPSITSGPDSAYAFAIDGTPIVLTLVASDPEGIPITWSYSVTSGSLGNTATVSQADNVFTITPSTNEANVGVFELTFTASDGVNIATAASTFTLAFASPDNFLNYNILLVKGGSTSGLLNTTFVDNSTNAFTPTVTGDVYQGSFSPYSPGGWSTSFDGSGDYLRISNWVGPGTSNFTVEAWIMLNGNPSDSIISATDWTSPGMQWYVRSDGKLQWQIYTQNGTNGVGLVLDKQKWYHVAWTREGTQHRLFINGELQQTTTHGTISNIGTTNIHIGGRGTTQPFPGYIHDFRLVIGTAVYTADFTPPTEALTAVTGTSILTCRKNYFVDESTNNYSIENYNDAKTRAISRFTPNKKYTKALHGGSAHFDGTGDYLTVAADNQFVMDAADFTMEAWIYPLTNSVERGIFNNWSGGGAFIFRLTSGNLLQLTFTAAPSGATTVNLASTGTVKHNQWSHVAAVRSGNELSFYINGVKDSGSPVSMTQTMYYYNAAAKDLKIGISGDTNNPFNGYMSDVRIVKGTAIYTANFTPPTAPLPLVAGTSILFNMNEAGIYDESGNHTISSAGGVATSTTQTKYGTTSLYYGTKTNYASIPWSRETHIFAGDWTIEAWVYPTDTSLTTAWGVYDTRQNGSSAANYIFGLGSYSSGWKLWMYTGSNNYAAGNHKIQANEWTHVCWARTNNIISFYVNGNYDGAFGLSGVMTSAGTTNPAWLSTKDNGITGYGTVGYIEDFRITNGINRIDQKRVPQEALTQVTGTSLLINGSGSGIVDATGKTLTINGNATSSTDRIKHNSYSMYFDGSGDYVVSPTLTGLGADDFTFEGWVYPTSVSSGQPFGNRVGTGAGAYAPIVLLFSNGSLLLYSSSNGSSWDKVNALTVASGLQANQWFHVSVVRIGINLYTFVNGQSTTTTAISTTSYTNTYSALYLGGNTTGDYFSGYLSDVRVVYGTGLYTTGFTPPTAALGFDNAQ